MTQQSQPVRHGNSDPGAQIARLAEVLGLVEELAGRSASPRADAALDEAARVSAADDAAFPVVQRRFDMLASETSAWAAACVEALLVLRERERPTEAAAARLAEELQKALARLRQIVLA